MPPDSERLYEDNLRLSQLEYRLQHIHLRSRPRCLGLVLSNRCNIGCIHCYQSKNGDSLLHPAEIGSALRREFMAIYPYLSTLRLQGGELFAITGFRELIEDVSAAVKRPILSISTNATLIDEEWAERIVRTPFQNVTVSLDAALPETYARIRKGGKLEPVLANLRRIVRWKEKLGSPHPYLDSFFVVMRSNFREIPRFLELMTEHSVTTVSFQTVEINAENSSRFPLLAEHEVVASRAEVGELHALLGEALARQRSNFANIRFSGLTTLFEEHGLDTAFLNEKSSGLYPDSDDLSDTPDAGFELCPNPWTTLFVIENGDVHLCFLAEAVGNLYEAPLAEIWNSPRAIAKRSHMTAGRYAAARCSKQWCSWREGKTAALPPSTEMQAALVEIRGLADRRLESETVPSPELASVRRMLAGRDRRVAELEAMIQDNGDEMSQLLGKAQDHIDHLEAKAQQAVHDFEEAEADLRRYRKSRLIRIASKFG